jgi:hypothetical protein
MLSFCSPQDVEDARLPPDLRHVRCGLAGFPARFPFPCVTTAPGGTVSASQSEGCGAGVLLTEAGALALAFFWRAPEPEAGLTQAGYITRSRVARKRVLSAG